MDIYTFGNGKADGADSLEALLGTKGTSLVHMSRLGIPVPAGFTLSTEACALTNAAEMELPTEIARLLRKGIHTLETNSELGFGDHDSPLLVSVRTSPPVTMPDVLPTVLNIGLTTETAEALAIATGDRRFAMETWAHFIEMFGQLVLDVDPYYFSETERTHFAQEQVYGRDELDASQLLGLAQRFLNACEKFGDRPFPMEVYEQLELTVESLFRSWESSRARRFRRRHQIADSAGTAICIQTMVFGNRGSICGTGMATTRDRRTGEPTVDGVFVPQAQGEVFRDRRVDGIHLHHQSQPSFDDKYPDGFEQLGKIATTLETHYRQCQEFEFTIDDGAIWVLQTKPFSSFPVHARIRVAVDMVDDGLLSRTEALNSIHPPTLSRLLLPRIEQQEQQSPLTQGTGTTPGAASGYLVFSAEEAERYAELNMGVIFVRPETTTDDMEAIRHSRGVVTSRGGMTSHAAIVTRQMGIPCIVGASQINIDIEARKLSVKGESLEQGDVLTINGSTGDIYKGSIPIIPSELSEEYNRLMSWADDARTLEIRSNADNSVDAGLARELGAAGIGLVRTEHMFFHRDRLNPMRRVILAHSPRVRREALAELLPFQRNDFVEIFEVMEGLPVTVRLFDPPLHEFLPERNEDLEALGSQMGLSSEDVHQITRNIRELNPMLGHRGCRLGISHPEIYDMQIRAVCQAISEVNLRGIDVSVELLIPLVSIPEEFRRVRARIETVIAEFDDDPNVPSSLPIGSMIEVARACLQAGEIAEQADFISFGTNDLTQSVFGISRDDASVFLPRYVNEGIIDSNPFLSIDTTGVGELILLAIERARNVKPDIRVGLCGEQGGNPASVSWLQKGVVDYISCSPYRVPIARLSAGQANHSDS